MSCWRRSAGLGLRGCLACAGEKESLDTDLSPFDRGKTVPKHHLIGDSGGIPLAITLTGGHRKDSTQLIPLVGAIPPVHGRRGQPRCKPAVVVADHGYDHDRYRDLLQRRSIRPLISRRGTRDNNQTVRWVVEQTLALLHQFRRLATRWERRTDIHHGFLALATSLVCWRRLNKTMCQEL